ncbi:MAG TPA: cytochrome c oxidase assembly factor Coa1 family protein [Pyrinomonadaceae bacterium]|nr:cytochrome c oxidase assembly factor Coa1 family protein [Pyrinomonadaceae bacterium]
MSTKKIVLLIVGIVAVLCLIVALFVGGITWFVFHTIGTSKAADTARAYLRTNEKLKQDIGEVKDFGSIVTGNVNVTNGDGVATLYLKVIGENREVNARVDLSYRNNRDWRVTEASYDRDGQTIDLMQAYDGGPPPASSP